MALTSLDVDAVASATGGRAEPTSSTRRQVPLSGVSIDSRTLRPGELFIAIVGPRFDGHAFLAEAKARGAAAAVVQRDVDPGLGLPVVRVADTTRALADLARQRRREAEAPVVAITGSAGKTTTKDLTATLLAPRGPVLRTEGNLNNQYGLPLTLLRLAPEHQAAVLEMGMSAPGELRALTGIALPDLAVITNVGSAHLEFFGSSDEIAKAKAEILEGLGPGGRAVLNADDPRVRKIGEAFAGNVVWFGRDRRYPVSGENWRGTAFGSRFDLVIDGRRHDIALPLPGTHSMMNFLAAAAVAHALGVAPESLAELAVHFSPGKHRGEVRRLGLNVVLIDDCYNSSPEALDVAIGALSLAGAKRRVAVLGDMLELGPEAARIHAERGEGYKAKLERLFTVGPLGREIGRGALRGGLPEAALRHFDDAAAAAAAVPDLIEPGDAVLVKASRGVKLEAVVEALGARFGEGKS